MRRGVMPSAAGLDFQSSTGIGGFNVKYDPGAQSLVISLRVGVAFTDALPIDAGTGVVTPATADFAANAASVTANNPTIPARVTDVQTNWQWSADQRTDWLSRYQSTVEGMWGGRHYFVSDRWEDLFANVSVRVDVHAGQLANEPLQGDRLQGARGQQRGAGRGRRQHGRQRYDLDGDVHELGPRRHLRLPQLLAPAPDRLGGSAPSCLHEPAGARRRG